MNSKLKAMIGCGALLAAFQSSAGLISSTVNVSGGTTFFNGDNVIVQNGGYARATAELGVTNGALYAYASSQAACSYGGDKNNPLDFGKENWCYGQLAANASMRYEISIAPNEAGRKYFESNGITSFGYSFSYYLWAENKTTQEAEGYGSGSNRALGSAGGRLTFNTDVVADIKTVFNNKVEKSGVVNRSASINGTIARFEFSATSNSSAQISSGTYGARFSTTNSVFVDPIISVDEALKSFVDIEVAALDTITAEEEYGQREVFPVPAPTSLSLLGLGLTAIGLRRRFKRFKS